MMEVIYADHTKRRSLISGAPVVQDHACFFCGKPCPGNLRIERKVFAETRGPGMDRKPSLRLECGQSDAHPRPTPRATLTFSTPFYPQYVGTSNNHSRPLALGRDSWFATRQHAYSANHAFVQVPADGSTAETS